jgi:predicted ATP-binding protein involved in virulence
MFSTHSPYLIEAEKLNRIRLIFKDKDKGTEIFNKLHTFKDKDTLAPVLTAIGMDISD